MGTLGGLEVFKSTSYRTGGYAINGGYITKFQCLEVEINYCIGDISGFCRGLLWRNQFLMEIVEISRAELFCFDGVAGFHSTE